MPAIGDSFRLVPDGHLWIIISDPLGANGAFIMVNVTTLRDTAFDRSCVLQRGDHPRIHHNSVIFYSDAKEWWVQGENGYDHWWQKNQIITHEPFSATVLRRIQDGALVSDHFKKKFRPRIQQCLVQSGPSDH